MDVQLEKGYVKIANNLYDAIARWKFSSSEFRILVFLIRKTYGWNKKEDRISLSQFVEGTGIARPHACRALRMLQKQNVITKRGNRLGQIYGIQKNYELWTVLPKGVRSHQLVTKGVIQLVTKGAHTKDKDTKDNIPASPQKARGTSPPHAKSDPESPPHKKAPRPPNMKTYDENKFQQEVPTINADGEEVDSKPAKRPELSRQNFSKCRKYFVEQYAKKYGFEPEPQKGEYFAFLSARKKYDPDTLKAIIDFFIESEKSKDHPSFNACFSGHTVTLYKQQEYRDNQKFR